MKTCLIDHQDDTPFSTSRTPKALFGQLAEGLGGAAQRARADDFPRAPIGRGILLAFGRMHAGRANLALLSARHPHAGERGKETQFSLVFNVHIGAAWWMPQQSSNCAFF